MRRGGEGEEVVYEGWVGDWVGVGYVVDSVVRF